MKLEIDLDLDFDIEPITLIYKFDLDILKIYLYAKNEVGS